MTQEQAKGKTDAELNSALTTLQGTDLATVKAEISARAHAKQ